jgi:hypothetical protein
MVYDTCVWLGVQICMWSSLVNHTRHAGQASTTHACPACRVWDTRVHRPVMMVLVCWCARVGAATHLFCVAQLHPVSRSPVRPQYAALPCVQPTSTVADSLWQSTQPWRCCGCMHACIHTFLPEHCMGACVIRGMSIGCLFGGHPAWLTPSLLVVRTSCSRSLL